MYPFFPFKYDLSQAYLSLNPSVNVHFVDDLVRNYPISVQCNVVSVLNLCCLHNVQPGPKESTLKCFIRRNRTTQTYYLYIGITEGMLLSHSYFAWPNKSYTVDICLLFFGCFFCSTGWWWQVLACCAQMQKAHIHRLPDFPGYGWYVKGEQHLYWQAKVTLRDLIST
jgi:hypothetical protein